MCKLLDSLVPPCVLKQHRNKSLLSLHTQLFPAGSLLTLFKHQLFYSEWTLPAWKTVINNRNLFCVLLWYADGPAFISDFATNLWAWFLTSGFLTCKMGAINLPEKAVMRGKHIMHRKCLLQYLAHLSTKNIIKGNNWKSFSLDDKCFE